MRLCVRDRLIPAYAICRESIEKGALWVVLPASPPPNTHPSIPRACDEPGFLSLCRLFLGTGLPNACRFESSPEGSKIRPHRFAQMCMPSRLAAHDLANQLCGTHRLRLRAFGPLDEAAPAFCLRCAKRVES